MTTEIIQPRRQDYTKKAQKAYYERVKGDPLKHREYLDRINKSRRIKREKAQLERLKIEEEKNQLKEKDDLEKFNFIKECLNKNQNVYIKVENGVITIT
jgi:hypothetical protein